MIVGNTKIKEALIKRWKELDLYSENDGRASYKEIVRDAMERSPEMKISSDRVSKYLNNYLWNGKNGGLTEDQIVWLCTRYGIPIRLNIGVPVADKDGNVKFAMPPYNELNALRELKRIEPFLIKKASKK